MTPLNSGRFLFLHREPSTPEFYLDLLCQQKRFETGKVSRQHTEPDEVPQVLAEGDPDTRAVAFFPHYDLNKLYNSCRFIDQPGGDENYSEVILFVHCSFLQDPRRVLCLDVAVRDAWLSLQNDSHAVERGVHRLTGDSEYMTFVRRCTGLNDMCDYRFPAN